MPPIILDPRLQQDTVLLGYFEKSLLLLMRNALYPWFIIVPNSDETELYLLSESTQVMLMQQINLLSRFVSQSFAIDKLNIGAIGNLVSQLHVHVVGRRRDDSSWPGVVWGSEPFVEYTSEQVAGIKAKLGEYMSDEFVLVD